MKKFIYSMFALAISAMTFTSCEDVPAPYALPGNEDPVVIEPTGSGTLEDPYNVAAALDYVNGLAADAESPQDIYIKGKVVSVNTNYNESEPQFGNAVFYISDDGTSAKQFYVYRALYLGNKKYTSGTTLAKGDEVIICGKVVNYKGTTPETVQSKAFLYSLNGVTEGGGGGDAGEGKGSGTLNDPFNSVAAANAVKNLTWTSNTEYEKTGEVYVKGKISKIATNGTFTEGGTYGNASFYISEDGSENGEFYCFRVLYLGNKKFESGQTDIKVGDEVIICGKLMNYRGNTPETVAGEAYLYSLNGATDSGSGGGGSGGSGEAKGDGSKANPFNAVAAANAVKDLTWTSNTEYEKTGDVYVKGKISKIANNGTYTGGGTYGNASFYISEDGSQTDEFYCFRILYLDNTKYNEYTGEKVDIKVGDEVVVYGKLMNYRGNTPETVAGEAYLYSLKSSSGGGSEGGGGGDDSSGGNSVSFATNSGAQSWAAATDGTYGVGFGTTAQGLNIGYYKHTSSSTLIAPNENHVRVYKNSALSIATTDGKKIKKIIIGCAPNAGTTSYCFDMSGLEGGASATCDKSALTVTWKGSATKVVLHANNGQVRMEKLTVEFE
jgi:exonuclease VII large subunit